MICDQRLSIWNGVLTVCAIETPLYTRLRIGSKHILCSEVSLFIVCCFRRHAPVHMEWRFDVSCNQNAILLSARNPLDYIAGILSPSRHCLIHVLLPSWLCLIHVLSPLRHCIIAVMTLSCPCLVDVLSKKKKERGGLSFKGCIYRG